MELPANAMATKYIVRIQKRGTHMCRTVVIVNDLKPQSASLVYADRAWIALWHFSELDNKYISLLLSAGGTCSIYLITQTRIMRNQT